MNLWKKQENVRRDNPQQKRERKVWKNANWFLHLLYIPTQVITHVWKLNYRLNFRECQQKKWSINLWCLPSRKMGKNLLTSIHFWNRVLHIKQVVYMISMLNRKKDIQSIIGVFFGTFSNFFIKVFLNF